MLSERYYQKGYDRKDFIGAIFPSGLLKSEREPLVSFLWYSYLEIGSCITACTRFHQTATNRCPDSNHKRSNPKNQYYCADSHFSIIIFVVVGVVRGILPVSTCGNGNAVEEDDYPTENSRCDGETHEHAILKNIKSVKTSLLANYTG